MNELGVEEGWVHNSVFKWGFEVDEVKFMEDVEEISGLNERSPRFPKRGLGEVGDVVLGYDTLAGSSDIVCWEDGVTGGNVGGPTEHRRDKLKAREGKTLKLK